MWHSKLGKLYVIFVLLAAGFFLIDSCNSILRSDIKTVSVFILFALMAELFPVKLMNDAEVTVGFAVYLGSIIILGYKTSVLVALISSLLSQLEHKLYKDAVIKKTLNVALYTIMVGGSGYIYEKLGGTPGVINLENLWPLIALIFSYFILNVGIMTLGLSIFLKKSPKYIFLTTFKGALPNYIALAPLGILLAVIYVNAGAIGLILSLIPLFIARHSFKLYMDMKKVYLETIQALASAIETKDPSTKGHSERVARLAVAMAEEMRLDPDLINALHYAALLHDIGKIGIPEPILNKPSKLSEEEYDKIKTHSELGANIVEKVDFLYLASLFIRYHHERLDGSGYPEGLKGKEIPLGAQIIAVADVFDALTTDRPYRNTLTVEEALKEIERDSGTKLKAEVVEALRKVVKGEKLGRYVAR